MRIIKQPRSRAYSLGALLISVAATGSAFAATPQVYVPVTNGVYTPTLGIPAGPAQHPGKEYSAEWDSNAAGAYQQGQVVLWDGLGGAEDGLLLPVAPYQQTDALANHQDALFREVINNQTAILFSYRATDAQGVAHDVGDAVYYETSYGGIGTWATASQVNAVNPPINLDGLEVFGPERVSDTDRYSLANDAAWGTSIYDALGNTILSHSALASAMLAFDVEHHFTSANDIDLDALMVDDADGLILFSLAPVLATGYFGDAVYILNQAGVVSVLNHGGHLWNNGWKGLDIDALEAAAVPVPSAIWLFGSAIAGLSILKRREQTKA